MKRPDRIDFLFAALVIVVGFAPLVTPYGWQGAGLTGDFACNCGQYHIAFSDLTYGGDRPNINTNYRGSSVEVVQVSDAVSTVDGLDLYSNFSMTRQLSGDNLVVDYYSPRLNFTKTVSEGNGTIFVDYQFGRNVTATLTFWRWYFTAVGPVSLPVDQAIPDNGTVPFTFFGAGGYFNATISSLPVPVSAYVFGVQGHGLNKLALTFTGDQIDIRITAASPNPPFVLGGAEIASTNYEYPLIGVLMASVYLAARSRVVAKA